MRELTLPLKTSVIIRLPEHVEGLCWGGGLQDSEKILKRNAPPPCLPSFWPCWEIETSKIFLFTKEAVMEPSLTLTDKLWCGFPSWWVMLSWGCPEKWAQAKALYLYLKEKHNQIYWKCLAGRKGQGLNGFSILKILFVIGIVWELISCRHEWEVPCLPSWRSVLIIAPITYSWWLKL